MSKVDISSEAVERLAKTADLFANAMKTWQHKTQKHNEDVRDTLRAQAERIKELEAENGILRTEKHADAEAIASARNNAMRDVRAIAKRYDDDATCMSCADTVGILREIDALIEGDTND